jgi:TetR/AcrR family transcriptional repressor of nem operon
MARSQEDKAASHERIVKIAARRMRESGTAAPGVAEIMRAAGLTHGGFYKHFASRDDLIAEAADRAFAGSERNVEQLIEGAEDPLAAFVEWYVSAEHRDDPAAGCPVVALGSDVARGEHPVRDAYRRQVDRYLATLERLLGDRAKATVALSTLVGSVTLARALGDDPVSDEILRDVRAALAAARLA